MNLSVAYCSALGGREENEDCVGFCADERIGCFALADGTGGAKGGALAARAVVGEVLRSFQQVPGVRSCNVDWTLAAARRALGLARQRHPDCAQMNTTLATLVIDTLAATASWCHLGDSRIYLFRTGRARILTHDHSVLQAMLDAGLARGEVRARPERSALYATVGSRDIPPTAMCAGPLKLMSGDVFLLCSDGFCDSVDEGAMEEALDEAAFPETWMDGMLGRIPDLSASHMDNASAVAVWVGPRIEMTRVMRAPCADAHRAG